MSLYQFKGDATQEPFETFVVHQTPERVRMWRDGLLIADQWTGKPPMRYRIRQWFKRIFRKVRS